MPLAIALRLSSLLAATAVGCGGDNHEEHEFETYPEYDAFFELEHTDNTDCPADHAANVTAGVPQSAIDAHCDSEFPS